jgi:hypothetical protein
MKTLEEYYKEVKKNAIDHWTKEGHTAFKNMENDPVINLLLSALSYQAFHIQKNIEQYEENTLRNFCDRIVPFHLIKPTPAFSIVETKIAKASDETEEKIIDESSIFEFKRSKFVPLLKTKILNAELENVKQQGKNIRITLQSDNPIENLSGLSFYVDTPETVNIETITWNDYELPLIKPSQCNELPFTKWFNNAHLFLNQNYYLFGTYDYWQEIFLTNTTQLFYIGQYDTKKIPLSGQTQIELEITLSSYSNIGDKLKINCIPVVNVEKKEVILNSRNPIKQLSSDTGEFLNLLYDKENVEEHIDSFFIRQHGVERYNPKQLLEQMQEILYRYGSDYYAFQSISELKNSDKLKRMQEIIDDISGIMTKFENNRIKNHYYAVLKKNETENTNVHVEYLTTSGTAANGIKKDDKAIKAPNYLDKNKTVLLLETKGGKNSIKDETQKENIAKYYFQTKDRLITQEDIRTFIKTFYYNENNKLGDDIETINIERKSEYIAININLNNESSLKNIDKTTPLAETLQNKIMLKSTGIMPFQVTIS